MATLTELFGSLATINIVSGKLTIDLPELATAHGLATGMEDITPDQIAALITMQITASTSEKLSDPDYGITIERSFDSIVARGTHSHYSYGFSLSLYVENTAANLDPDDVV